jgi:hypothetical protein
LSPVFPASAHESGEKRSARVKKIYRYFILILKPLLKKIYYRK